MAETEFSKLSFSLPEDSDADQLLVYTSATEGGAYSLVDTLDYEYGQISAAVADIDVTKWYKIKFKNSVTEKVSPLSTAVAGSGWTTKGAPSLFVSTSTDGAAYATVAEVYAFTGGTLDNTLVPEARISAALRSARAIIDVKCAELDLDRFAVSFESEVARKKYNASLLIVKEAELNFALGNAYLSLADDKILQNLKDVAAGTNLSEIDSISIGATSISSGVRKAGSGGALNDLDVIVALNTLSSRYFQEGAALLVLLVPTTVPLRHTDRYVPRTPLDRLRYYGG